ncbi:MAG: hypothetical protein HY615_00045 [Candidatus Rokubacteria bacterium]|nr:hypothetical protein [Candidatus Rokubacteria bacterium]
MITISNDAFIGPNRSRSNFAGIGRQDEREVSALFTHEIPMKSFVISRVYEMFSSCTPSRQTESKAGCVSKIIKSSLRSGAMPAKLHENQAWRFLERRLLTCPKPEQFPCDSTGGSSFPSRWAWWRSSAPAR